ncbi:hypothetical protein LXA43DRAFT_1089636 [Ganoderma leucocontextum]|nr:hypothetical protein LXA43DRAFT_1089636 [Ganoderma leucocontextum]
MGLQPICVGFETLTRNLRVPLTPQSSVIDMPAQPSGALYIWSEPTANRPRAPSMDARLSGARADQRTRAPSALSLRSTLNYLLSARSQWDGDDGAGSGTHLYFNLCELLNIESEAHEDSAEDPPPLPKMDEDKVDENIFAHYNQWIFGNAYSDMQMRTLHPSSLYDDDNMNTNTAPSIHDQVLTTCKAQLYKMAVQGLKKTAARDSTEDLYYNGPCGAGASEGDKELEDEEQPDDNKQLKIHKEPSPVEEIVMQWPH